MFRCLRFVLVEQRSGALSSAQKTAIQRSASLDLALLTRISCDDASIGCRNKSSGQPPIFGRNIAMASLMFQSGPKESGLSTKY